MVPPPAHTRIYPPLLPQTRTENPHEANLFYVPLLNLYRFHRRINHYHVLQAMQYIQQTYPGLWNRHQGAHVESASVGSKLQVWGQS